MQISSKTFEVRRDTRPIFDLELATPSESVSFRDGSIKFKIKVKLAIKSSIIGSSEFEGILNVLCEEAETGIAKYKKSLRIIDETVLELNFKDNLGLAEIADKQSFNLLAAFTDDITNKTFNASTKFTVLISDFTIQIVHSPQFFKPQIPYSFTLLVTKADGLPVLNSETPVRVTVKDDDGFILTNRNFTLDPKTGAVEIDSIVSLTAAHLKISAKYDRIKFSQIVYKSPSLQKDSLSINALTPM